MLRFFGMVLKGVKVKLWNTTRAREVFHGALRYKVDQELDRLINGDRYCKFSDWAAPIVPVLKADGSIRICDNYKQIINR